MQSGAARTGRWWGHQHWLDSVAKEAAPDLLIFAKGIASGYPFAGVAGNKALFDPKKMPPGTLVCAQPNPAATCLRRKGYLEPLWKHRRIAFKGYGMWIFFLWQAAHPPPHMCCAVLCCLQGGTYGGNAVACAAAAATIDVINDEGLAGNATARGTQLMQGEGGGRPALMRRGGGGHARVCPPATAHACMRA